MTDDLTGNFTGDLSASKAFALSAMDGRYREQIAPLAAVLSEESLMLQRLYVEVCWLLHLAQTSEAAPGKAFAALDSAQARTGLQSEKDALDSLLQGLGAAKGVAEASAVFAAIKQLEKTTRHDVKAVEYHLRDRLEALQLGELQPLIHFACTSEDINSTAWGRMLLAAVRGVLLPALQTLADELASLAEETADLPMLARTHGQPASPTTFGKEIAVFSVRLQAQLRQLQDLRPAAKFSGATGNFSAHHLAVPELAWPDVCRDFVESLQLECSGCTTQVEPADRLAEICHCLMRTGRILTDLSRDCWGYISLGYLVQQRKEGEVGSSTMPHKVNPIDFENAEGNLAMAHALLERLAADLPVSRWQRDLSGSTQMRNIGQALGHHLVACLSLQRGLQRVRPDAQRMAADLQGRWEVLAEAVQTLLRLQGSDTAYEQLHRLTAGLTAEGALDGDRFSALVDSLTGLSDAQQARLKALTPQDYTGLAAELARRYARGG